MTTTVQEIGREISSLISAQKEKKLKEANINAFLDEINNLRSIINRKESILKELDNLICRLTWVDLETEDEKNLVKSAIRDTLDFHKREIKTYVFTRNACLKTGICKDDIKSFKNALDDLKDTTLEAKNIFFTLREDKEINDLMNSI